MRSLARDLSLSPVQRAYVLGLKKREFGLDDYAISLVLTFSYVLSAAALIGTAIWPESVPRWAFNLGRFVTCIQIMMYLAGGIITVLLVINLANLASEAENPRNSEDGQRKIDALRKHLDWAAALHCRSHYRAVIAQVTKVSIFGFFIGFVMNGYIFVPIVLAVSAVFAWFTGLWHRVAVTNTIKQLFPEPIEAPVVVEPLGTSDTGLDLVAYKDNN